MKTTPDWIDQFNTGGVAQKTTPVAGDRFLIDDSAASFVKKYTALSAVLGGSGTIIPFGCSLGGGDVGKYIEPHGNSGDNKFSTLSSESQVAVPASGTIEALSWSGAAVLTNAVFKIWKNGLVVATVTVTGQNGVSTGIGVSITAGDLIALEYDAVGSGGVPGKSMYEMFIRGT